MKLSKFVGNNYNKRKRRNNLKLYSGNTNRRRKDVNRVL